MGVPKHNPGFPASGGTHPLNCRVLRPVRKSLLVVLALACLFTAWSYSLIPESAQPPCPLALTFLGSSTNGSGAYIAKFYIKNVSRHPVLRERILELNLRPMTASWLPLGAFHSSIEASMKQLLGSGESEVLELELPRVGTDCHWQLMVPFECDSVVLATRRWLDKRRIWPGFLDWYVRSPVKGRVSSAVYEILEAGPNRRLQAREGSPPE
jgi:hypothetical protein